MPPQNKWLSCNYSCSYYQTYWRPHALYRSHIQKHLAQEMQKVADKENQSKTPTYPHFNDLKYLVFKRTGTHSQNINSNSFTRWKLLWWGHSINLLCTLKHQICGLHFIHFCSKSLVFFFKLKLSNTIGPNLKWLPTPGYISTPQRCWILDPDWSEGADSFSTTAAMTANKYNILI